jgi:hypothetical protein
MTPGGVTGNFCKNNSVTAKFLEVCKRVASKKVTCSAAAACSGAF